MSELPGHRVLLFGLIFWACLSYNKGNVVPKETITVEPHQARLRRLRRGVITTARGIHDYLTSGSVRFRAAMVTLTYAPGQEWEPGDIGGYMRRVRAWAKRRGVTLRGVWVLELTKRGVPHYHVVLWLPRGFTLPKPDKQGHWCKGSTRIEWARSPVGYVVKYASKGVEGSSGLPKGARLWGAFGRTQKIIAAVSWWCAPAWLRGMTEPESRLIKRGSWWESVLTGIFYRSPWVYRGLHGGKPVLEWYGFDENSYAWPRMGIPLPSE